MELKDRVPCDHKGCLHHVTHPCEGCGRIAGMRREAIPKGSMFTVTSGEYDGFELLTVCRALVDIDVKAMQEEYLSEHDEQRGRYSLRDDQVMAWMIKKKGYAEEIGYSRLHLATWPAAEFSLSPGGYWSE